MFRLSIVFLLVVVTAGTTAPSFAQAATSSAAPGPGCEQARQSLATLQANRALQKVRPNEHAARVALARQQLGLACGARPDSLVVTPDMPNKESASRTSGARPMLVAPPGLCVLQDGKMTCPPN